MLFTRCPYPNKVKAGFVIFTSSQTYTIPRRVKKIDIFCVGGGGAGGDGGPYSNFDTSGGGGGGGYTKTVLGASVTPGSQQTVIVGAGGRCIPAALSGASSFGSLCSAAGGYNGSRWANDSHGGGNGGSGGGAGTYMEAYIYDGGSDGGNGDGSQTQTLHPELEGRGQGTTTRAFGEPTGTLYSGGGGGGVVDGANVTYGGSGGGGKGGNINTPATAGTPNTGGGGGGGSYNTSTGYGANGADGGSGIVIIRWEEQ